MQTYVVYISMLLLAVLFSRRAQRTNKTKYIILTALMFTLVAGLRAESVGIDTKNYDNYFDLIAVGRLDLVYGLETTFKYVCLFLLRIWDNHNFVFFVFAIITNVLVFVRLWDFKNLISLPFAAVVYFGVFYFMTFNIMRQLLAASIVFWATRYIVLKKYYRFLLYVLIASLFHRSALIGVFFVAFDIFAWKHLTKKQRNLICLFSIIGIIALLQFGSRIIGRYSSYFQNIQLDFGILLFFKLALLLFTASSITKKTNDTNNYYSNFDEAVYVSVTTKVYYAFGILLTAFGYIFTYMDRVGIYFYLFEIVYMGMLIKSKRIDTLMKLVVLLFYLLLVFISLSGTGQGQGNYLFCWQ